MGCGMRSSLAESNEGARVCFRVVRLGTQVSLFFLLLPKSPPPQRCAFPCAFGRPKGYRFA